MSLEIYEKENNEELVPVETIVGDAVAEEILYQESDDKKPFLLLVLLVFCLFFLGASVAIAIIAPGINSKSTNVINSGSILFSYSQTNSIEINDALPMSDEYGKNLNGENEFFDFVISIDFINSKKKNIEYEISAIPSKDNTIPANYIRVYLIENDKAVLINNKTVNNFSELKASKINKDGKFLYKTSTNTKTINSYVFRMWLSDKYYIDEKVKSFKCSIVVNAY
jgi:hypothetical protein